MGGGPATPTSHKCVDGPNDQSRRKLQAKELNLAQAKSKHNSTHLNTLLSTQIYSTQLNSRTQLNSTQLKAINSIQLNETQIIIKKTEIAEPGSSPTRGRTLIAGVYLSECAVEAGPYRAALRRTTALFVVRVKGGGGGGGGRGGGGGW